MNFLLFLSIFIMIVLVYSIWIVYIKRENSFRKVNQMIDRKLLGKKYIDLESWPDNTRLGKHVAQIPTKIYSLEQSQRNELEVILYTSMSGEVSVKGVPSEKNYEQAYQLFLKDIEKCHVLHKTIFLQFESAKTKNNSNYCSDVILALQQDVKNAAAFLHDLFNIQKILTETHRFKYIDIDRFTYENFELYLDLKVFYNCWLIHAEEMIKYATNKSKTTKRSSKKETSNETKLMEKESNNGVTNVKRRRTRTSNSSTKKSSSSEQKDI